MATILARVRFALVDLRLAQIAGVAGVALAGERVVAVDTVAPMARIGGAVVDVGLAGQARITGWTFAGVAGN